MTDAVLVYARHIELLDPKTATSILIMFDVLLVLFLFIFILTICLQYSYL